MKIGVYLLVIILATVSGILLGMNYQKNYQIKLTELPEIVQIDHSVILKSIPVKKIAQPSMTIPANSVVTHSMALELFKLPEEMDQTAGLNREINQTVDLKPQSIKINMAVITTDDRERVIISAPGYSIAGSDTILDIPKAARLKYTTSLIYGYDTIKKGQVYGLELQCRLSNRVSITAGVLGSTVYTAAGINF